MTITHPYSFQLPANAYISVKTGTDDLLLCQRTGPFTLAADEIECQWTVPLVTIQIHYGDAAPTKGLGKLIEIQKNPKVCFSKCVEYFVPKSYFFFLPREKLLFWCKMRQRKELRLPL